MITLQFLRVGWDHRHEINRQLLPFQTYKTDHFWQYIGGTVNLPFILS